MRKLRTTSANWIVRHSVTRNRDFMSLDSPYPKKFDYEWGLRQEIDKYFYLAQHPEIEDGGAWASGLCRASGDLSKVECPCGGCPVKAKTGKSNCEGTAFRLLDNTFMDDDREDIYKELLAFMSNLYTEMYHERYEPKLMEDGNAVIPQQKNKPTAGTPWS